jgi:D-alanyl-D-alanine carboxypeptidase/D-alanyl-D-alanine-endopeptidase (penicillin-binding protein 4)
MVKKTASFFILYISCSLLCGLHAQHNALQAAINAFAKEKTLRHATISATFMDAGSGKTIAGFNIDKSLTPASSLKTVTTATALSILGADYKFKTELQYDGKLNGALLDGNLYIKGFGDPTLGSPNMELAQPMDSIIGFFLNALKKKDIKKINGLIVGDGSYFSSGASGDAWAWNDLGNYYGAGAFGLNINENYYTIHFIQNNSIGKKLTIKSIEPNIQNLLLVSEVVSAEKGSGDNAYIFGAPYTYLRHVRGTLPIGSGLFKIKGSMPDPPLFAAQLLANSLQRAHIEQQGYATTQWELEREGNAPTNNRTTLYTHFSPALKDIVKTAHFESVNLYCEAMLRELGKRLAQDGSAAAGIKVVMDFWKEKGLDTNGFFMEDGSGLSPKNAVSSYQLAKILQLMSLDKQLFPIFYETFPQAGQEGTVKNLLKNTKAASKIKAKSGSMERVRSYTGYIKGKNDSLICFSIIVNNYTCSNGALTDMIEKTLTQAVN